MRTLPELGTDQFIQVRKSADTMVSGKYQGYLPDAKPAMFLSRCQDAFADRYHRTVAP